MQTLRYARRRQTRTYLSPPSPTPTYPFFHQPQNPNQSSSSSQILNYFKTWFPKPPISHPQSLPSQIFKILRTQSSTTQISTSLSNLHLHLTESLILTILNHSPTDVLSCLKFFDWAGRQPGFHHTRLTFNAIFRILSKTKHVSLMLDFLQNYMNQRYVHKVRYYNVLVIGYSVAGKPETALTLFGRMRFMGVDLDSVSYHVLLNSLVEYEFYDCVDTIRNEIRLRGFMDHVTHSIVMKFFVRTNEFDKGEVYLRDHFEDVNGVTFGILVSGLCKVDRFEKCGLLIDEFREKGGLGFMEHVYGVWVRDLVKAGKLDGAIGFLKDRQIVEGYVPDVVRYNMLITRLLRENRLDEVYDLLIDMKDRDVLPDDVTMNVVLCFLCKAGRMDIAIELYDCRSEFGLSVNRMAYDYILNALVGDVSIDEAYRVLKEALEHDQFPSEKTFAVLAEALCREGMVDKVKDLVLFALDKNIMSNNSSTCDKIIAALCLAKRVESAYKIHDIITKLDKQSGQTAYKHLISGFSKSSRGDIAARLLVEMQDKGFRPSRYLVREVIACLCRMDNPESNFFTLLEMQLARRQLPPPVIYNFFIEGAGHAKKPELAMQVYEMMTRSGLEPGLKSDILVLQSYLKSRQIGDSLYMFHTMSSRKKRLWHAMIVGLCKANKPESASKLLEEMKAVKLKPSIECYEELIKLYCDMGKYHRAIDLVNDMTEMGRPISSFIGNVFLLHSLKTWRVFRTWADLSHEKKLTSSSWTLGHLTGIFCGAIEGYHNDEELEELVQRSFQMDVYTINMLIRRSSMKGMDYACKCLERLRERGFEPNRWTYDIIVHGFVKDGRYVEARMWEDEMHRKGFDLTEGTKRIICS